MQTRPRPRGVEGHVGRGVRDGKAWDGGGAGGDGGARAMVLETVAGERTCRMCRGVVGKMRGGGVPAGTVEARRRRKRREERRPDYDTAVP